MITKDANIITFLFEIGQILIYPIIAICVWFNHRVTKLENKECIITFVPRSEFELLVKVFETQLKSISIGVNNLSKRLDEHFKP